MRVRFVGTGTPLGQRGLHQACILVEHDDARILLDCGLTALVSLARAGVDPERLDAVLISHLHGDDRLRCKRLILTHLGPSMLEHLAEVPFEVAMDGLTIEC